VSSERVAQALRDHQGHAGYAASELRELADASVKEPDFDDKDYVETLLTSPIMFKHVCQEHFEKFDENENGMLEWEEIVALTGSLYSSFGLKQPSDEILRAFFNNSDENQDGSLSEPEFRKFFESFLRHAFFETDQLRKIVDSSKSKRGPKVGGC